MIFSGSHSEFGQGRGLNPSTQNPYPQSRYFLGLFIALPHLSLFYEDSISCYHPPPPPVISEVSCTGTRVGPGSQPRGH